MATLKEMFQFYLDNQEELVKKYNGKTLVIKDNAVVGSYDSEEEAYFDAEQKYGLGNFLLQKCSEGDKDYTATFHSRVRIPAYATSI